MAGSGKESHDGLEVCRMEVGMLLSGEASCLIMLQMDCVIERPTGDRPTSGSGRPRTPCRPSPYYDVCESNDAHAADDRLVGVGSDRMPDRWSHWPSSPSPLTVTIDASFCLLDSANVNLFLHPCPELNLSTRYFSVWH